jgi:hypothetical protein
MGLFIALSEIERKRRQACALHSLVLDLAEKTGRERDANELSKAAKRLDKEIATLIQSLPHND